MSLAFSVEAYSDAIEEMRLLYPAHWAEVAHDTDSLPLDVNYERYLSLESAGMLHVAVARQDGRLVGYHIFVVLSTFLSISEYVVARPVDDHVREPTYTIIIIKCSHLGTATS